MSKLPCWQCKHEKKVYHFQVCRLSPRHEVSGLLAFTDRARRLNTCTPAPNLITRLKEVFS